MVFVAVRPTFAATCDAGYYLENGECKECNPNTEAFYCPGDDTRHACPTTDTDYEQLSGWTRVGGYGEASWAYSGAPNIDQCHGYMLFRDTYGNETLIECPFNGENYWCDRRMWYTAGNGYYLSDYLWTSVHDWYSSIKQCTNAPANAHYTGPGTPDAPDGSAVDANDCPWECNAGYYGSSANGDTSCAACGSGNYCTGGTHRATCASLVPAGAPMPTPENIHSLSNGSWSDYEHCGNANDCICDWYFDDETRILYGNETACANGPIGPKYTLYKWCRTGYYAADPLGWGNWYTSCKPCTNKPANATYTSYSTPSVMYAVESNCPWVCDAGFGKGASGQCLPLCDSGMTILRANSVGVPLFNEKHTVPALAIEYAGQVCYADLVLGPARPAINIDYKGQVYHTVNE